MKICQLLIFQLLKSLHNFFDKFRVIFSTKLRRILMWEKVFQLLIVIHMIHMRSKKEILNISIAFSLCHYIFYCEMFRKREIESQREIY